MPPRSVPQHRGGAAVGGERERPPARRRSDAASTVGRCRPATRTSTGELAGVGAGVHGRARPGRRPPARRWSTYSLDAGRAGRATAMCRAPRGPCRSSAAPAVRADVEQRDQVALGDRPPVAGDRVDQQPRVVRFSVTASSDRPGSQRMCPRCRRRSRPPGAARSRPAGPARARCRGAPPGAISQASQPPPVDQLHAPITGCIAGVDQEASGRCRPAAPRPRGVPLRSETYAACRPSGDRAGDQLPETSEAREPVPDSSSPQATR